MKCACKAVQEKIFAHPFPEGIGRGDSYNPHLKGLSALIEELTVIGTRFNASPDQVMEAAQITLTAEEICRLEKPGDETGIHTLREWEDEMV